MPHETLGLLLIRYGLVTREQLSDALRLQRQNGRMLGTCLLSLGYLAADQLLQVAADQLGVPCLPPGSLASADPAAVSRVPAEVALKLRVVPYSWDGQMLGLAVADPRVLDHLEEVAQLAHAAVGAYLALEMEVETTLGRLYGRDQEALQKPAVVLPGRPRPSRIVMDEVPTRGFGEALGLEPTPVALSRRKSEATGDTTIVAPAATPKLAGPPPPAPKKGPPPPAAAPKPKKGTGHKPAGPALERMSLYTAVEELYAAGKLEGIAELAGRAMLNYFERVCVLCWAADSKRLDVVGIAGLEPERAAVATEAAPALGRLEAPMLRYGVSQDEESASELYDLLGVEPGVFALIAAVEAQGRPRIVLLCDNGDSQDRYEDLHDVEMLLKESETALNILLSRPIPIPG